MTAITGIISQVYQNDTWLMMPLFKYTSPAAEHIHRLVADLHRKDRCGTSCTLMIENCAFSPETTAGPGMTGQPPVTQLVKLFKHSARSRFSSTVLDGLIILTFDGAVLLILSGGCHHTSALRSSEESCTVVLCTLKYTTSSLCDRDAQHERLSRAELRTTPQVPPTVLLSTP